jgi:hypothetical protein
MRIVLRHQQKAVYLQAPNSWVKDPSQARDFLNAIRALHYCVLHSLQADVVAVLDSKSMPRADSGPDSGDLSSIPRGYIEI